MKTIICALSLVLASQAFAKSASISMEDAAAAAKEAGFKDKIFPKSGETYSTSREVSAKKYSLFKAFPKSKTDTSIKQIAIDCNQCETRKATEGFSVPCYEDVQTIARKLKIDLPGGVIKAYEDPKTQQKSWDVTDKTTKNLRFTKTKVKCEKGPASEGIRFDFFFK